MFHPSVCSLRRLHSTAGRLWPLFLLTCCFADASVVRPGSPELLQAVEDGGPSPSTFTVPLQRQDVPVLINGRVAARKSAYFGALFAGQPVAQEFRVVFDTGSGHLFLPSAACQKETCKRHRRYARELSQSAQGINFDGTYVEEAEIERDRVSLTYGTGEIVGDFVHEVVCLAPPGTGTGTGTGPPASTAPVQRLAALPAAAEADLTPRCAQLRVVLAEEMSEEPFAKFFFDGVLGLGLGSLALDPEFHFLSQLAGGGKIAPVFSFFLADDAPHVLGALAGEITFGGHDAARFRGGLHWVPVAGPEHGYWRVQILGLRVGDESVPLCGDGACTAIVDTGSSLLGVPSTAMETLLWKTAREAPPSSTRDIDCRGVAGRPLFFDLAGGYVVAVEAADYTRPLATEVQADEENGTAQIVCRASFLPVDMPSLGEKVFIWGEPVLRRHYTSYDAQGMRIGFALSEQGPRAPTAATQPMAFVV